MQPSQNEYGLRILYLEDNRNDAELMEEHLNSGTPVSITRVISEDTFKQALQKNSFDAIISDSRLPSFDTMRALAIVKRQFPDIPFIFFSGNTHPQVKEEALAQGATGYLNKDDMAGLISMIECIRRAKEKRKSTPPPSGKAVMVRGKGFRCLAFQDADGKWRDCLQQEELPEVIDWVELED